MNDPLEVVLELGRRLGCLVCPDAVSLKLYGRWESIFHEIGHFAIAPRFLWDVAGYVDAAAARQRPPVPRVNAFVLGLGPDGGLAPEELAFYLPDGGLQSGVAAIIENPNPLTDWHVRAWQWWVAQELNLPSPSRPWLQSSPWADLLFAAEHGVHRVYGLSASWASRHQERTEIWRQREATRPTPEQELSWRLEDLEAAGVLSVPFS